MIEVAKKFVEPVNCRKEWVPVAQMVLAKLASGVAHGFEHGRDRRRLVRHAQRGPGLPDRGQPSADWQLARDEVGAACRATRFGVIVGEPHAFRSELVKVWCPPGHDALMIGADVK